MSARPPSTSPSVSGKAATSPGRDSASPQPAEPGSEQPGIDLEQERRIVEAARDGDESAIEALYRTYYSTIYRYAFFRVGSATTAEDVTSQVFLGMVRHLPRFAWKDKPFVAWLYAIAQKQVAQHHRSAGRAMPLVGLDEAEDLIADTAGPEATAQERERRLQLAGALRMLPESQREVVLLRHVLSLSLAETAAVVGKSEGAIKQLQVRGLATLKEILATRL